MSLENMAHTLANVSTRTKDIEYALKRIENKLNQSESISDKLQLFLESPDSITLDDSCRNMLTDILRSK